MWSLIYTFLFGIAVFRLVNFYFGTLWSALALLFTASSVVLYAANRLPRRGLTFVRGRQRPTKLAVHQALHFPAETVDWGGDRLPAGVSTTHFLVAGTTGSGKTLMLNQLMASVLPYIGKRRPGGSAFDRRALIYDPKGDILPNLHQITDARIVTIHPFQSGGASWDIARDITTPAAALQMSAVLIPQDRNTSGNPFFILAAQNLMRGAMLSLMQTVGHDWTFRDVLLSLRYEERLRQLLDTNFEGRAILDQFFRTGSETLQGVRATLATKTAPFEVIAAAWDTAVEKISLQEFINGEMVLVIGNDEETRTALDAINRVLFKRLSELILAATETTTRQTWIFLDEIREAGAVEGLSRLMTMGRSKGACVAIGFQAIEGMREVYGDNIANEITGLCNNKCILRLDSPASAKWASELFGKAEVIDRRATNSRSNNFFRFFPGLNRSVAEHRLTSDAVMPSEIMTLPPASPEHGLHGFFLTRSSGAYRNAISWDKMVPEKRESANITTANEKRSGDDQYLREWGADDYARLNLKPMALVEDSRSAGEPNTTVKRNDSVRCLRASRANV